MKTIPPSSIESARTFSVTTGFYITQFKWSLGLGDQSINALVFLKHIFQKEEQEEKDSGWAGWTLAHWEFGVSINPIPAMGADYANCITACPPGIENLATSLR